MLRERDREHAVMCVYVCVAGEYAWCTPCTPKALNVGPRPSALPMPLVVVREYGYPPLHKHLRVRVIAPAVLPDAVQQQHHRPGRQKRMDGRVIVI